MSIATSQLQNISFSTQFRYANVKSKSHIDFNFSGYDTTINIPHGLSYKPFFRLYIQFSGSPRIYHMESGPGTYELVGEYQIEGIGSDTTNIYIQIANYNYNGGSGRIYYRIYEDAQ